MMILLLLDAKVTVAWLVHSVSLPHDDAPVGVRACRCRRGSPSDHRVRAVRATNPGRALRRDVVNPARVGTVVRLRGEVERPFVCAGLVDRGALRVGPADGSGGTDRVAATEHPEAI